MKFVPSYCRLVLPALFVLVLSACSDESDKATDKPEKSAAADSANHGYNELANPDSLQSFAKSDFNTDLKIYYNDFVQEGRVVGVSKDTLRIRWRDFDNINNYVRWAQ